MDLSDGNIELPPASPAGPLPPELPVEPVAGAQASVATEDHTSATGSAAAEQPAKSPRHGDIAATIQSLAITVVIAVFVVTFVIQAFQIPSESMENTLLIGDYLLVDKIHYAENSIWGKLLPYKSIRRGDIVVFRPPPQPQMHFVKRVIGLPGDHVRMWHKQIFINGKPLQENYTIFRVNSRDPYRDDFPRLDYLDSNVEPAWWVDLQSLVHNGELIVPPDRYFVLGDNRDQSLDSRYWGFVPRENIIGRPLVIYWSLSHPGRLGPAADTASDKLLSFAYTVTHLFQETRWNRTFRRVR